MDLVSECIDIEGLRQEPSLAFGPHTLLYTSFRYLTFLQSYLSCELSVICVRQEGILLGYLPLAFKKSSGGKVVCNALPYFGSNGGPVLKDNLEPKLFDCVLTKLMEKAMELVKLKGTSAFTIISNPFDQPTKQWLESNFRHDYTDDRIGQITPLPLKGAAMELELLGRFQDPRPRNIRRALKAGITISYGHTEEHVEFLHSVHTANITAIGGIPKEKKFFERLSTYFRKEDYRIYVAEIGGKKIGALLVFYFNKTVEYFTPATLDEYRGDQPSALIIYEAMKEAVNDGFSHWNWGGTWLSQEGVYDFKKKWGTNDYPYRYFTRLFDSELPKLARQELLVEFPYFYTLPFDKLIPAS